MICNHQNKIRECILRPTSTWLYLSARGEKIDLRSSLLEQGVEEQSPFFGYPEPLPIPMTWQTVQVEHVPSPTVPPEL